MNLENTWQHKFLTKGTELGCGDLSIMIGVVSEIIDSHRQAELDDLVGKLEEVKDKYIHEDEGEHCDCPDFNAGLDKAIKIIKGINA